jgi:hypothetical protein
VGGDKIAAKQSAADHSRFSAPESTVVTRRQPINASNSVAFVGSPAPDGGNALFAVGGRNLDVLASDAGPFHLVSGAVSLNDSGEVAFHTILKSKVNGIYIASKKG